MHIAIIGLGEVGRCYARALHAAGIALSLCNVRPSAAAVDCASSLALPLHTEPGAWLGQADLGAVLRAWYPVRGCRGTGAAFPEP